MSSNSLVFDGGQRICRRIAAVFTGSYAMIFIIVVIVSCWKVVRLRSSPLSWLYASCGRCCASAGPLNSIAFQIEEVLFRSLRRRFSLVFFHGNIDVLVLVVDTRFFLLVNSARLPIASFFALDSFIRMHMWSFQIIFESVLTGCVLIFSKTNNYRLDYW